MSEVYEQNFWNGIKPDPILSVSEWADQNRILSQKASAEPGFWRTSRTPFLKAIMDDLSTTSIIEDITFMKGAQIGGTECGNNWVGYVIDQAPGPMMVIQPTVDLAKRHSKQRIAPLIEECPSLKEKVKDPKSRDSGNTVLTKEYPGGLLILTGSNSPVGLRSAPVRYIFLDEIDAYSDDCGGEGSPIDLAEARTRTFSKRKKFKVSTPTIEGRSKIEAAYELTDQRKYFVPCPHCQGMQVLRWPQVKWPKGKPMEAIYICEHCEEAIENWQKTKMLAAGEWRSTAPENADPKVTGYHLSSLYSPVGWISWGELAKDWVKAQGNNEKLRTFVNTVLGETWKDKGDAPDWKRLYERREVYELNQVQPGVLMVTAGADIQKDRIEVEIVGWGRNMENWSVDYRVFHGDTSDHKKGPWLELEKLTRETWTNGKIDQELRMLCVDSGYNTNIVYAWCRQFSITKVRATKGSHTASVLVGLPSTVDVTIGGRRISRGMRVFSIGVSIAKQELYGWLKMSSPDEGEANPYGWSHFPEYDEEFFKMLTAEQLIIRWAKAVKKYEWEKTRERNEALDCRIMARVGAAMCGIDRFQERHWTKLENEIGLNQVTKQKRDEKKEVEKPQKKVLKRRKSRFL